MGKIKKKDSLIKYNKLEVYFDIVKSKTYCGCVFEYSSI